MKINKEGNIFTFGFASVMVVVVATLLSVAAISLKPFQKLNEKQEKMQNILKAIRVECSRKDSPIEFEKYVKQRLVLNYKAKIISEKTGTVDENDKNDGFNIDALKEYKSVTSDERNYPLYICEKDGKDYYVVPMVGKGLWGPIWGFISITDDFNTVYGATFDHKSETPGLGSEINQGWFQLPFRGERIFDESDEFVSVKIVKGGADKNDMHGVDAITGGTITSNAVSEMIERTFKVYVPYLKKMQNN
ncbi:MAG: NADH:ubiquinone reductase (Na(+)-transporting) subunit C [Bacteroidota bacterium]